MKGIRARSLGYVAGVFTLVALGWILTGQAAGPVKKRVSLPTDWSHRHVVFSNPTNAQEYARVANEPRYLQQLYRREFQAGRVEVVPRLAGPPPVKRKKTVQSKNALHRDWAVNLGTGATMGPGNYPAKFGFDVTKADCAADYVVYSTGLAGRGTQASIVGFTNLYSGCGGTVPTVNWAYNTDAGLILTSPITSLDGTQIAFVQTSGSPTGIADLVLLKWAASGTDTVSSPTTLTTLLGNVVTNGAYRACTAPCMTTIRLRTSPGTGGTPLDDRTSSVFYDFKNDIIWVGGAQGWVHKFTGVFSGTPAAVTTGGFPAHLATDNWTSSAVFDRVSNKVFVGDDLGVLYAIDASTGTVTASGQLDFGVGIVDAPIIDQTGGVLYVFASADNATGNCLGGGPCSAVYRLSTAFSSGDKGTEASVGDSVVFPSIPNPMYIGGFDSTYYSSANRTGNLYVCGNTGFNATLYQIPITAGNVGQGTPILTLAPGGSTAGCSSVTDVANPNTSIGPAERIYLSVRNNGRYAECSGGGCLINLVIAEWKASTQYIQGQQILSPDLHVETVVTAGTSGASPPAWNSSAAATTTDNDVVWIDQGALPAMATVIGWEASHPYGSTTGRIIDSNGNVEVSTTPGTSGTPNPPLWSTTPGTTTSDGSVTWTNVGFSGTFALPSTGGTSGIIEDNVVSPLVRAGASQVYFTTLGNQSCGATGTGGCAVQASQPALK